MNKPPEYVGNTLSRNGRLYPRPSDRIYWHLTCLRQAIEEVVAKFIAERQFEQLVDFGCGNMPYRPLFEPMVRQYVGCDLKGNALADRHVSGFGELPFPDDSVDIVLSSQVLEHVHDVNAYLSETSRVLKSEGILVLSTHGVWRFHPDPEDYWRWTSSGLRSVVSCNSFTIRHFRGVMGPEATSLQLLQDARLRRLPKRLQPLYRQYMQWRIRAADLSCPPEERDADACVYVVVAEKSS